MLFSCLGTSLVSSSFDIKSSLSRSWCIRWYEDFLERNRMSETECKNKSFLETESNLDKLHLIPKLEEIKLVPRHENSILSMPPVPKIYDYENTGDPSSIDDRADLNRAIITFSLFLPSRPRNFDPMVTSVC